MLEFYLEKRATIDPMKTVAASSTNSTMMWKMGCLKWITSRVPENSRRSAIISSKSSLRHSTCTLVRGKSSSSAPFCWSGSSSPKSENPIYQRG